MGWAPTSAHDRRNGSGLSLGPFLPQILRVPLAELKGPSWPWLAGSDSIAREVDGGKPLEIDGSIVLCGRSDDTAQRGFTGSLAELALWNTAITAQQVSAIYNSVSARCLRLHQRFRLNTRTQGSLADVCMSRVGGDGCTASAESPPRLATWRSGSPKHV